MDLNKLKKQKNVAIFFIAVPIILLIPYLGMNDFDKFGMNNYLICGALLLLLLAGVIGLRRSLKKQNELNN